MVASRVRTVSFYEVVRAKDDYNPRMEEVPWQRALEEMSTKPSTQRTFITPDEDRFIGEAVFSSDAMHLIVGRIGSGELQTVDLDHGHIEDLRLDGNRGFIDTTAVCFLDYGNIIGIMGSSQASPRATAIQRWMNACGLAAEEIALWPVISQDVWTKLQNASAVHNFEFTFRPNPAFMPPDGASIFGFRQASDRYPDHRITFKVEVPKRGQVTSRARGHRRLQEDAMHFMSELGYLVGPSGIERARALVTSPTEDGHIKEEGLDFLKHHVTAKKRVEVRSAEDSRPRYATAIEAILEAAQEHANDLRAAVSG
ncbi:hypothetical protein [Streptomyces gibsoniae]|uniref:Uncharacterized protein n=1 Tax=Streptomyces gibsoniae TaxID=3075529 RepID=A0ABU2U8T9_9ACTN|nr:hypothetical protein [Streptomyces sp. DSM 41699]MDT0469654.1 hypothetical protein [Streptomyces sp. DSM 41699]